MIDFLQKQIVDDLFMISKLRGYIRGLEFEISFSYFVNKNNISSIKEGNNFD